MKKTGTFFLNRDNFKLGFILGLIAPLIVMVIVYYLRFTDQYDFDEFLRAFLNSRQLITFWGVWCLVGNIVLFTYYINTSRYKTAWGVFIISVIYGICVPLLKLMI